MTPSWLQLVSDTGALYYPCCGNDFTVPLEQFGERINTFHFSDSKKSPPIQNGRIAGWRVADRRAEPVKCHAIERGATHNVDKPQPAYEGTRHSMIATKGTRTVRIVWHQYDSVQALEEIEQISVFFFRGDCPHDGEGSSGVLWLQKELLHRIIARFCRTGLIVTDGSNGYHPSTDVSWHPLWNGLGTKQNPRAHDSGAPFSVESWQFCCRGSIDNDGRGPVYVWHGQNTSLSAKAL